MPREEEFATGLVVFKIRRKVLHKKGSAGDNFLCDPQCALRSVKEGPYQNYFITTTTMDSIMTNICFRRSDEGRAIVHQLLLL